MEAQSDIIIGTHSILEALKNPERKNKIILATNDALKEFKREAQTFLSQAEIKLFSPHDFQIESQKLFRKYDFEYQRIPSGLLLLCDSLLELDPSWVIEKLKENVPLRLICLDQVTDVHNAAAIFRTAAFYGVDAIIISVKGNFGRSPSFTRIASGALEHVKLIRSASLPRTLTTLKEKGVVCIGLSEESTQKEDFTHREKSLCLVLGAEDKGLSHAVERVLDFNVALNAKGPIKTLNVSVAAALAMEKFL